MKPKPLTSNTDYRLQWAAYYARRAEDTARMVRGCLGRIRKGTDSLSDRRDVRRGTAALRTFADKIDERTDSYDRPGRLNPQF